MRRSLVLLVVLLSACGGGESDFRGEVLKSRSVADDLDVTGVDEGLVNVIGVRVRIYNDGDETATPTCTVVAHDSVDKEVGSGDVTAPSPIRPDDFVETEEIISLDEGVETAEVGTVSITECEG